MNPIILFWSVTLLYFAVTVYIGIWIYGRVKGDTGTHQLLDFWIATRRYKGWWLACSLASGWLMLGWLGYGISMVYMMGLSGLWCLPLPWLILCFIIIWMVPHVRKFGALSLPEAIQKRYGGKTRTIMALCSIFVFTSWTGAETYMAGQLASPFLHTPPWAAMIVVIIPIMIYTYLGGFRASIITDLFQFILCGLFITVLAVVGLHSANTAAGGHLISQLSSIATPNYGPGTMFGLFACGFAMPIILLLAYIPGWMIEQDLLLRIQGAKSLSEAKKGAWWGLVLIGIFVILMPVLIAFSAIILFPPGAASSAVAIGKDATGIISAIILHYFPLWAQVLMLVGILAAQMSTIDTFANIIALPLIYDFVQPFFFKKMSRESVALWTRILSVAAVGLGLIYGLNATSLMDIYTLSSGVLTASIAIPAIAMFIRGTNRTGVIWSAILGFAGNVIFYILEYKVWQHNFAPKWFADTSLGYIMVGLAASIIGLVIGSWIGKPATAEQLASIAPKPLEGVDVFDLAKEPQG